MAGMDLSYGPQNEAFRREVDAFLGTHWRPPEIAPETRREAVKAFRRAAVEAGYLYRGIPRRYGGAEQPPDLVKAQIIREAFAAAGAPVEVQGNGVSMVVPTLLEHGTAWQKEQFIRPTIEGEYEWAQGYSEPGAGSDLASLRTRGELIDGEWVINGQKVWTSFAHKCRYMFALVRTEPEAAKHAGISYLLLDLNQPGVVIRPLRQMTGELRFSEVFFDDAKAPADWIVGARGQGWAISRTTLKHERATLGGAERTTEMFEKLVALAGKRTRLGRPAIQDPEVRQALAALEGWILAQKCSGRRGFSLAAAGLEPGLLGLLNKLLTTRIAEETARLSLELIGEDALLQPAAAGAGERRGDEKWLDQIMGSLGISIAGGTSNIQRNIIAERGLGLPRESSAKDPPG